MQENMKNGKQANKETRERERERERSKMVMGKLGASP
jgi:hypothetical protein